MFLVPARNLFAFRVKEYMNIFTPIRTHIHNFHVPRAMVCCTYTRSIYGVRKYTTATTMCV